MLGPLLLELVNAKSQSREDAKSHSRLLSALNLAKVAFCSVKVALPSVDVLKRWAMNQLWANRWFIRNRSRSLSLDSPNRKRAEGQSSLGVPVLPENESTVIHANNLGS